MKENNNFYYFASVTLSIIIPAYNVEKYIDETLNSIANQSNLPDEIIIINDGSTDNTSDKIKSHPLSKFINLIETENRGQGNARNIGIETATCDYIYFFDSDDILTKDFIEKIKKQIINNDLPDLIFFSGKSFKDKGFKKTSFFPDYIRPFEGVYATQSSFFKNLIKSPELSCSPCLYISKRSLWINNNLQFNDFFHEDEEILYPLIFSAYSYVMSKDIYFLRRIRNNSTMTQIKSIKHEFGLEAVLSSLLKLLDKNKSNHLRAALIRRRLGIFCLSYLAVSDQVSGNLNYKILLRSILESRNIKTPLSISKYMVKKNAKKIIFNKKLHKK